MLSGLRRRGLFIALAALFIIIAMLLFPSEAMSAAGDAVSAWLTVILPSLMPFAIAASVLTGTGAVYAVCRRLDGLCRAVFGYSGLFLYAFICSCISGYPMGAKLTAELKEHGSIGEREADAYIRSASTSGPLFLIGSISVGMLGDPSVGVLLACCHYSAALLTALVNGHIYRRSADASNSPARPPVRLPIGNILSDAVSSAAAGMLAVLGFMVLFTTAARMLSVCGLSSFLPQGVCVLLTGSLELASGCMAAAALPRPAAVAAMAFFAGFGGFSVIAQSAAFAARQGISCRGLLASKLMQGGLSALPCALILRAAAYIPAACGCCALAGLLLLIVQSGALLGRKKQKKDAPVLR